MKLSRLRTALAVTTALVGVAFVAAQPAALAPAAPGGGVFIVLPGATATSATVAMQMSNGVPIAIGTLNPTTGTIKFAGLGSLSVLSSLSGLDGSGVNVTAAGGTTAQIEAARAGRRLMPSDIAGAKCDGATDDTATLNTLATKALAGNGIAVVNCPLYLASPANVSLSTALNLVFEGTGKLIWPSGTGPSINSTVTAPDRQIFSGATQGNINRGDLRAAWFGTVGDGSTDNLAALNAAAASLTGTPYGGGRIHLGAGRYNISATLTISTAGIVIDGYGAGVTQIYNTATSDVVSFSGNYLEGGLKDLMLGTTVPSPTSGCGVNAVTAGNLLFERLRIQGTYNGACINSAGVVRYNYIDVSQIVNDSYYVNGTPFAFFDHTTTYQNSGSPGNAAYHFVAAQGVQMANCTGQSQNYGVLANPTTNNAVFDVFIQTCDLDNDILYGLDVDTSGGGQVYSWNVTGTRIGFSSGTGIFTTGGGGTIYNLTFDNMKIEKNAKWGVNLNAGIYIGIFNSSILGNAATGGFYDGMAIGPVLHWNVMNNTIGRYNAVGNNQRFGVNVTPFAGDGILKNNIAIGNATGGFVISSTYPGICVDGNVGTVTGNTTCTHSEGLATGVSAAGTTQATARAIVADVTAVTTVASGAGVVLPAYVANNGGVSKKEVLNRGANALLVYPPSGAAIEAGSANAAVSLAVGGHATFECVSATQCYQAP